MHVVCMIGMNLEQGNVMCETVHGLSRLGSAGNQTEGKGNQCGEYACVCVVR